MKYFLFRSFRYMLDAILPKQKSFDMLFSRIIYFVIHGKDIKSDRFNYEIFKTKHSTFTYSEAAKNLTCKSEAKKIFTEIIGEQYVVPSVIELPYPLKKLDFPESCVIKPSHLSGEIIFRKNGERLDYRKLHSWGDQDQYSRTREPNYKGLKRLIIVEDYIFGEQQLMDYKFFCKDGKILFIQLDFDRHTNHTRVFLSPDWTSTNCSSSYPVSTQNFVKPINSQEMSDLAENLSSVICRDIMLRVDLYSNGTEIKVGEITFCHGNAVERFIPVGNRDRFCDRIIC